MVKITPSKINNNKVWKWTKEGRVLVTCNNIEGKYSKGNLVRIRKEGNKESKTGDMEMTTGYKPDDRYFSQSTRR